MSYNIVESMVRQRLREKSGQVYCADCLAKDLEQDPSGGQGGHGCAGASPRLRGWILPVWSDGANASLEGLKSPKGRPLEGGPSPSGGGRRRKPVRSTASLEREPHADFSTIFQ